MIGGNGCWLCSEFPPASCDCYKGSLSRVKGSYRQSESAGKKKTVCVAPFVGSGVLWYLNCGEISSLLFLPCFEAQRSCRYFSTSWNTELVNSVYCTGFRQLLIDPSPEHLFWLQTYYTNENWQCLQFQRLLGHSSSVLKKPQHWFAMCLQCNLVM